MKKIYLLLFFIFILSQMVPLFSQRIIFIVIGVIEVIISNNFKPNFSAGKEYKSWMFIVMGFIVASTLWSINPQLTMYITCMNILPLFCLTYSLSRYIDCFHRLITVIKLMYIAGVISLIYLFLFVDMTMLAGTRISGAMTDEGLAEIWNVNSIGMNFALTILLGFVIVKYERKKIYWIIWTLISCIMLVAIMLTGSRKAILLLVLPFIILALYDYKRHFLKAISLILGALGVLWMTLNIPFFYDIIGRRIEELFIILSGNETGHEDTSRKALILLGFDWFSERPFLGYGMNCFRVLSNMVPRFAGLNFYAHNNYIEVLVGGGIIGFSLYYSYVLFMLRRLFKHKDMVFRYAAIIMAIVLLMDFAQVSYYDAIMQVLIVMAFILVRIKKLEIKRKDYLLC